MRGIELTIAIGSALGLFATIIADAAQQRMTAAPAEPAAINEFAETPTPESGYCVPFDQAGASAGWAAATEAGCPAVVTAYDGSVG